MIINATTHTRVSSSDTETQHIGIGPDTENLNRRQQRQQRKSSATPLFPPFSPVQPFGFVICSLPGFFVPNRSTSTRFCQSQRDGNRPGISPRWHDLQAPLVQRPHVDWRQIGDA